MSASTEKIYFLLQRASAVVKKQADTTLLASPGISTAQTAVLVILKKHGAMSQRELAQHLSQQESAITTMVGRLKAADLVSKQRSREDARAWEIEITTKGLKALLKGEKRFAEINAILDKSISEKDLAKLAVSLTRIVEAFESK